eukprot:238526_1
MRSNVDLFVVGIIPFILLMATWFSNINDVDTSAHWQFDTVGFDISESWGDATVVKTHLDAKFADKSAGERAGLSGQIRRFVKGFNDFKDALSADTATNLEDQFVQEWVGELKINYTKCATTMTAKSDDDDDDDETPIPFGPWLLFSKNEWDELNDSIKQLQFKSRVTTSVKRYRRSDNHNRHRSSKPSHSPSRGRSASRDRSRSRDRRSRDRRSRDRRSRDRRSRDRRSRDRRSRDRRSRDRHSRSYYRSRSRSYHSQHRSSHKKRRDKHRHSNYMNDLELHSIHSNDDEI